MKYILFVVLFIVTFVLVFCLGAIMDSIRRNRARRRREYERNRKALNSTYYYCPYCGGKTTGNQLSCSFCGAPLGNADIKYKSGGNGIIRRLFS